jgi:hypothetical protein
MRLRRSSLWGQAVNTTTARGGPFVVSVLEALKGTSSGAVERFVIGVICIEKGTTLKVVQGV